MNLVVLTSLINILSQSVPDIKIQTLNVEVHIVCMELLQHLVFGFDVAIDSQEGWNLFGFNMYQVLVGEVA